MISYTNILLKVFQNSGSKTVVTYFTLFLGLIVRTLCAFGRADCYLFNCLRECRGDETKGKRGNPENPTKVRISPQLMRKHLLLIPSRFSPYDPLFIHPFSPFPHFSMPTGEKVLRFIFTAVPRWWFVRPVMGWWFFYYFDNRNSALRRDTESLTPLLSFPNFYRVVHNAV